jgi:geranylgeranyl pyrophosphate synthase
MNINDTTHSYLLSMLPTIPFEQTTQVIEYRFTTPSHHWLLPLSSCQAFGGSETQAIPAISSLIAIQTAILLVDDLLDNDGRREKIGLSIGETANLATVFQALSIDCFSEIFTLNGPQFQAIRQINKMFVETAYGQYLDNKNPETEDEYWRAARAKSCPFFGLAFYLGAVAGGATAETAESVLKLGRLYGEMIQIHDDLDDSLTNSAGSDWTQQKNTLPILFARVVQHPEREKFMALSDNSASLDNVREAQDILLRCGAVSYCIDEIIQRHKIGVQLIAELNLPNPQPLDQVFDEIIAPIWSLLKE